MKFKNVFIGFMVLLALSLSIPFVVYSLTKEPPHSLPVLGRVQGFALTDSTGRPFHSDELKGKVWVASFFFTTCSDICPRISENMASLSRAFEEVENVTLVSITVNPEQDSPEALARYARTFGARSNWHFLTGTRSAITEVAVDSFKLGDMKEPIFHSGSLPLVDSQGFIRGYYDGTKEREVDRLLKDAAYLAHR